jgi:transposase
LEAGSRRIDDLHARVDANGVSETTGVGVGLQPEKRIRRTAEEKLRIVEATLVLGASIERVAREQGVNANQVFQWRYEYRKGILPPRAKEARAELLPVTLATEPSSAIVPEIIAPASPPRLIHIELPGRALVNVESGVDPALVRAVLESLLR